MWPARLRSERGSDRGRKSAGSQRWGKLVDAKVQRTERARIEPLATAANEKVRFPRSSPRGERSRATASPSRAALRQLLVLRSIAVSGQIAAIIVSLKLDVALPVAPMLSVVGALIVLNALMSARLRSSAEFGQVALVSNLGLDLAAFTLLLFYSGGAANPFYLVFVLHGVLMALLLPVSAAAIGVGLVVLCYVGLLRNSIPLSLTSGAELPSDLLAFGQSLSFALTTSITAWFVIRIVRALREKDRLLSESAQRALRDEAVMKVGALAAGAAHELSTPLTTMAVAAKEISHDADAPAIQRAAAVLREQIEQCRGTLANLMAAAGHAQAAAGGRERLDLFLDSIASQCRAMHPGAKVACDWSGIAPAPDIFADQGLRQAFLSVLNNAVDASPEDVSFAATRHAGEFQFCITDSGPGVSPADIKKLGRAFFTTKAPGKGAGLGLVLATRAIERMGGSLSWCNASERGVRARIVLPIGSLQLDGRR